MKHLFLIVTISCLFISCEGDIWGRMPPHADFKMLNNECDAPCKVSFINTSIGNGNAYSWIFFNSSSVSTAESPEQVFEEPGVYEVQLSATNSAGFSSISKSVIINQPKIKPIVNFSMMYPNSNISNICEYACQVSFENKTLGIDATYLWDFGDGSTSTNKDVVHQYNTSGVFTVTLTASNIYGTSSGSRQIRVLPYFTQLKVLSVKLNDLDKSPTNYDVGETFPHSCPDLYINVQTPYNQTFIIQNRDINVLNDAQSFPIVLENKDDKFLLYYENYNLQVSDYDNQISSYYDDIVLQFYLSPGNFIVNLDEVTYPDNTKHWIADVPFPSFMGIEGSVKLEYFQ